jgi:hypothetical protein
MTAAIETRTVEKIKEPGLNEGTIENEGEEEQDQ